MAIIKTNHQRELEAENLMLIKMNPIKQQPYKKKINQIIKKLNYIMLFKIKKKFLLD